MSVKWRSLAGIILKEKRLFIALRKKGATFGEKWEFPGGKADECESDETALKREYLEEFGVDIVVGSLFACSSFQNKEKEYELYAYLCRFADEDAEDKIQLSEHTQWRWAALDEIYRLDFMPSDQALFPAIKTYLEQFDCYDN